MKTIILFLLLVSANFAQSELLLLFDSGTTTPPVVRDSVPDQFTFIDITGATASTAYTSNYVTLENFDSAYISITGSGTGGSGSFRNAVLLTHSSGARLYDYDAYLGTDSTDISVPLEMDAYNTANSYTGVDTVGMVMRWYPVPDGTDWANWYADFTGTLAGNDVYSKLDTFNVIIFKGGIQTTQMTGYGSASDTSSENLAVHIIDKTIIMYKYIWRELVDSMANHPDKFWVIMTGAACPERFQEVNGAQLSHEFAIWAKDTLAMGLDAYGDFPSNIYVFDYFHYLADAEYNLKPEYEIPVPAEDFHQNATACDVIAPIFVQEVFDAAIAYETSTDSIQINEGSWSVASSMVYNNDSIRVKLSSGLASTSDSITATVGGISDTYTVTTSVGEQMETTRYLAALGTPLASGTETAIDSFVVMLKDSLGLDSLPQFFNAIYLHAIETEEASLKNLVKRSHDITESGTDLIWTQNEGWAGGYDGGTIEGVGYLDCNYNLATDTNGIAGRLSIGITTYVRQCDLTDAVWDAQSLYNLNDGGGLVTTLSIRRADDGVLYKLNDDTFNSTLSNATNNVGVYTLSRTNATRTLFKNSASFLSETVATTGIPNLELWLMRNNANGTASGRSSPKQISITMVHRGVNLTEHQTLRNICEWWMDRWGKGVL